MHGGEAHTAGGLMPPVQQLSPIAPSSRGERGADIPTPTGDFHDA